MSWDAIAQLLLANSGTLTNGVLAVILLWFAWFTYRRIVNGDLVPRAVHEDNKKLARVQAVADYICERAHDERLLFAAPS